MGRYDRNREESLKMSDLGFKFAEDIPSALTREECSALATACAGKVVLEIGSQFGRSTIALASAASRVHAVDWHKGDAHAGHSDTFKPFLENLERHGVRNKVVVHLGTSEQIAPILKPASFDLVFIDAFHERSAVEKDAALCLPLVRPGGIIAFHDYGVTMSSNGIAFGVTEAVDGLARALERPLLVNGTVAMIHLE